MLVAMVHHIVMNGFQGATDLKPICPCSSWNLESSIIKELNDASDYFLM